MAKKAPNKNSAASLAADDGTAIPRLALGEVGFSGLRVTNKQILEEANRVFRHPEMLKVVSEMSVDPTVSAALNVYKMMIGRVEWSVKPPEGATQQEIDRAKFIESCKDDMEGSWGAFISEVLTYLPYGYSIVEKVFRRRLKKFGSKYNDGLVGIGKLAPRGQDTIRYWYFSDDGRDLVAVGQSIINLENGYRYTNLTSATDGTIRINRDKFLLFSADSVKSNPQGKSILKSVFLPYKQLTLLKDQLMLGVAKDLQGIPKIGIPTKYMASDASAEDKAIYEAFKTMVNQLADGTQRGVIMPLAYDDMTKNPMFSLELLEAKGGKAFDIPGIIKSLQNDILVALSVDVIALGNDQQGSFSLADAKTNLLSMQLEHRLKEIREVLNKDLMYWLYKLNGWDTSNMATFEFGDLSEVDSEAFSKLVQRVASVGLVEVDRAILNKIREVMGVEAKPDDEPVDKENLSGASSKAGAGMEPGTTGNGTAKVGGKSSGKDSSASNADNKG
jgi:hypothetical protein